MKQKLIQFTQKYPVRTFWIIAVLLAIVVAPFSVWIFMSFPDFNKDINVITNGKGYNTNILYSIPIALQVSGGILFAFIMLLMPATASIAGIIAAYMQKGKDGLKELFSRFRFWSPEITKKEGIKIWLQAIVLITFLNLLYSIGFNLFGGETTTLFEFNTKYSIGEFVLIFISSLFFDGGALMEEIGWRGFALPNLQKKFTPLKSSIILGVIWALWHIPIKLDLLFDTLPYFLGAYFIFTLGSILISIIITYFYNRLGGSILIGIAIHGLSNDSTGIKAITNVDSLTVNYFAENGLWIVVLLAVVMIIIYKEGDKLGLRKKKETLG